MRNIPVIGWTDGEHGEIDREALAKIGAKPKNGNTRNLHYLEWLRAVTPTTKHTIRPKPEERN